MFGDEVNPSHVMAAVGLLPGDAHRDLPPQVVSTGLPTLIAPVRDGEAIARAAPDFDLVEHLLAGCGAVNLYLAWIDGAGARAARMFTAISFRAGRIPATGSAAGPLCAYLAARGRGERVEITQGVGDGPAEPAAGARWRATGRASAAASCR